MVKICPSQQYVNRGGLWNFQEVFLDEGGILLPFFYPSHWLVAIFQGSRYRSQSRLWCIREAKNMTEGPCFHISPGKLFCLEREIKWSLELTILRLEFFNHQQLNLILLFSTMRSNNSFTSRLPIINSWGSLILRNV